MRDALLDPGLVLGGERTVEILLKSVTLRCQQMPTQLDLPGIEAGIFCLR